MKNKRMDNSVKSLVSLYTVVIGVALSLAVVTLIDVGKGLEVVTLPSFLLFFAFIATLFPFYHGALRHLDDAYIENNNQHIKVGALVIDFVLLFLHALAFVVLSLLLRKPQHFIWVLSILLTIDVFWGVFVHYAASSKGDFTTEFKWATINFVFVGLTISYLVTNDIYLAEVSDPVKLSIQIVFVCSARSLVDYIWCKDLYFPK